MISAVKAATRQKQVPLNSSISLEAAPGGDDDDESVMGNCEETEYYESRRSHKSKQAELYVLYGRRRVGKTELLRAS